ncbi:MAG: TraR/DksA family transcriptional regulator, partial [Gemmatimonadota bacterium]
MPHTLTPAQLQELRQELERELTRLQRTMLSTGDASQPVILDQSSVGRLSRMDALANQEMAKALHGREQALELKILNALKRMDEGR